MVTDAGGLIGAGVAFDKWFAGFAMGEIEPAFPATRNLRPTEGLASNNVTRTPAEAATSAARRPDGPPPMTASWIVFSRESGMPCYSASACRVNPV